MRLRSFALLAAVLLVMAGCSSASSSSGEVAASWTFKDDLGKTVSLEHRPLRVAGFSDTLLSLMKYGIQPVAAFGQSSIRSDPRFAGLDTSGITEVGATYGEIDVEKLVEAAPDVIVADVYPTDSKGTINTSEPDFGFNDLTQQKQVEKIAPIVTRFMGGDGASVIRRTTELASSLGAAPATISAAQQSFSDASAALKTAAAGSKVTVTAFYADADGVNVVKAPDDPMFRLYEDLGVRFFAPAGNDYYWGNYSWENAGKIGGDLVLLSQSGYQKAELLKQPTFASTAAGKAGQIEPWVNAGLDYVSQAAFMKEVTGYLTTAEVVS